jgi:hypothetical protein
MCVSLRLGLVRHRSHSENGKLDNRRYLLMTAGMSKVDPTFTSNTFHRRVSFYIFRFPYSDFGDFFYGTLLQLSKYDHVIIIGPISEGFRIVYGTVREGRSGRNGQPYGIEIAAAPSSAHTKVNK